MKKILLLLMCLTIYSCNEKKSVNDSSPDATDEKLQEDYVNYKIKQANKEEERKKKLQLQQSRASENQITINNDITSWCKDKDKAGDQIKYTFNPNGEFEKFKVFKNNEVDKLILGNWSIDGETLVMADIDSGDTEEYILTSRSKNSFSAKDPETSKSFSLRVCK